MSRAQLQKAVLKIRDAIELTEEAEGILSNIDLNDSHESAATCRNRIADLYDLKDEIQAIRDKSARMNQE